MAKTIVFLHGFLGQPHDFESIIQDLEKHKNETYDCIAIDLNQNTSFNLKSQAEYVREKLEYLNIKKAHFWGYSMGGRVLLELYKNHPEMFESMTLESVGLGLTDQTARNERVKTDTEWATLLSESKTQFLEKWYGQSLFDSFRKSPDFHIYVSLRAKTLSSHHGQMIAEASPGANSDHYGLIESIKVPTLALVGQFDEKYREIWGKFIDKNPNLAIEIIKNSGHVIHFENPAGALNAFKKFTENL